MKRPGLKQKRPGMAHQGFMQIGAVALLGMLLILAIAPPSTSRNPAAHAIAGAMAVPPHATTTPTGAAETRTPSPAITPATSTRSSLHNPTQDTSSTEHALYLFHRSSLSSAFAAFAAVLPAGWSTAIPADAAAHRTPSPTATPTPQSTLSMQARGEPDYVPILMYHYIRTIDPEEDALGYSLSVSPELFDEQMAWLHEHDYTPVRMDTLAECLRGQQECPDNMVALTFDDGYEDAATNALPILERYGFPATFYIVTDFVGQPGYLSWDQIRTLHESGMEIGSHSISHPDLTARSTAEARREIVESREILETQLDTPVQSFCYPIGAYNPDIAAMVHEAGYTSSVTTHPGPRLDALYELPRRRIRGDETVAAMNWYVVPLPEVLAVGTVTEDGLNVRAGAGTDYEQVENLTLRQGERVEILAQLGGQGCETWFEIRLDDGTKGWVCSSYVQVSDSE